ncbi:hypothetical protein H2201_005014 [Coniosporium apollinis]|uniref:NADAR domain-containing protein n=1 Tax=Coniosporium apollinis TaxID=61459 RepID=A0ABQ9NS27_9PEZI|nr:hypothetical protein H2201_005014 [Coniosporium apollinis]
MSATALSSADDKSPVYFWREYDHPYGFLSQWYDCAFEHDGISYRSAEMWMMMQKAKLFGDEKIAQQMVEAPSPKEHKALGRKVKGFDSAKWDERECIYGHMNRWSTLQTADTILPADKSRIVEEGNWWKFTKSKETDQLKKLLLETGDRELVEASPFDRIWGVGFGANNAGKNRDKWGENLLGKALMRVRDRLRQEEQE